MEAVGVPARSALRSGSAALPLQDRCGAREQHHNLRRQRKGDLPSPPPGVPAVGLALRGEQVRMRTVSGDELTIRLMAPAEPQPEPHIKIEQNWHLPTTVGLPSMTQVGSSPKTFVAA